jgi:hypothetical protein
VPRQAEAKRTFRFLEQMLAIVQGRYDAGFAALRLMLEKWSRTSTVVDDLRKPDLDRTGRSSMMRSCAFAIALLAFAIAVGCKNMPGANGQYATHDHGNDNRPH